MLRNVQQLDGYAIRATDGVIGHVKDFYFDDEAWVVRYLVVDTGNWLSSREVLISPIALSTPVSSERVLPAALTKDQVRNSPDIDTRKPVSRQYEMEFFGYYGYYPHYWGGSGLWGSSPYPDTLLPKIAGNKSDLQPNTVPADLARVAREVDQHRNDDPHLRSVDAVTKYHIEASDGGMGHVKGLLVDENTWAVRYLVVDTSNWWGGHQVLIAPQWIEHISWHEASIRITLTRDAVKKAPAYDPSASLGRGHEIDLYRHYDRAGYWAAEVRLENPEFQAVPSVPQVVTLHSQHTRDGRA
jgi:hypothetical protein